MDDKLIEYKEAFEADIISNATALEQFNEHSFFDKFEDILLEYGEIETIHPCHYQKTGYKINGYSFDDLYENLILVVSHYIEDPSLSNAKVGKNDVQVSFKRLEKFFTESRAGRLSEKIEISNEAHDVSNLIHECKELLSVKFILITNGIVSEREAERSQIDGIDTSKVIWDISRAFKFESTGERDSVDLEFETSKDLLPCVQANAMGDVYTTYLAFIRGDTLSNIYGKWKIQLLERNVRVFLSQRPAVNQGIRDTILKQPEMFCAYNNGITLIAKSVELNEEKNAIKKITDLQIVNGGQTTASLYHTKEKDKNADLENVIVQMKIVTVNEEKSKIESIDEIISKVGLYSNTQNNISKADLRSNDPPHPELHALSQNLAAPDPTGGSLQSFWYYENSRGSYEEKRRLEAKTPAQKRKFDQKFPKNQKFDKIKFSKAWNSYLRLPHIVCLGASKNFNRFNDWLKEQNEDWNLFYQKTVALILIWSEVLKLVGRQKYGGYRTEIAVYTMAWFHFITKSKIDLMKIWSAQKIDDDVLEAMTILSTVVNRHLRNTNLDVREYSKKEDCWEALKKTTPPELPNLRSSFVSKKSNRNYDPSIASEAEAINFCVNKGGLAWKTLSSWLKDHDFMPGKPRSQAFNMGRIIENGKKEPSGALSKPCKKIWEDAEKLGWNFK